MEDIAEQIIPVVLELDKIISKLQLLNDNDSIFGLIVIPTEVGSLTIVSESNVNLADKFRDSEGFKGLSIEHCRIQYEYIPGARNKFAIIGTVDKKKIKSCPEKEFFESLGMDVSLLNELQDISFIESEKLLPSEETNKLRKIVVKHKISKIAKMMRENHYITHDESILEIAKMISNTLEEKGYPDNLIPDLDEIVEILKNEKE